MRLARVLPEGLTKEKVSAAIFKELWDKLLLMLFAVSMDESLWLLSKEAVDDIFSPQLDNIQVIVNNIRNFFIIITSIGKLYHEKLLFQIAEYS